MGSIPPAIQCIGMCKLAKLWYLPSTSASILALILSVKPLAARKQKNKHGSQPQHGPACSTLLVHCVATAWWGTHPTRHRCPQIICTCKVQYHSTCTWSSTMYLLQIAWPTTMHIYYRIPAIPGAPMSGLFIYKPCRQCKHFRHYCHGNPHTRQWGSWSWGWSWWCSLWCRGIMSSEWIYW